MASEGPRDPGTMADDDTVGTRVWVNPDNAKTSDNSFATAFDGNLTTHYLKLLIFDFLFHQEQL